MSARQQSVPPAFGQRLRRAREARQWSLREAGGKCGLNASTIMRVEAGRDTEFSSAIILPRLYGLSMDALLAESSCDVCDGMPPDGFACLSCGAGNAKNAATGTDDVVP
jgi:transcriptional regulator with XRE-family HTH domain